MAPQDSTNTVRKSHVVKQVPQNFSQRKPESQVVYETGKSNFEMESQFLNRDSDDQISGCFCI